jgi:putative hydrolase of the HAD superfamily
LFDVVGTLLHADPPVPAVYRAAGLAEGIDLAERDIARRFAAAFARQEALDAGSWGLTSETRELERWRDIVHNVFAMATQSENVFERLWNHFAQGSSWRLHDDVAATWEGLHRRGLRLGIASNFDSRLDGVLTSLPPLAACNERFISSQIGYRKPALEFFRTTQERLHVQPGEVLLVGDDWENDYQGALRAGWQAVLLCRDGNGPEGATRIRSLTELTALVDGSARRS